MIPPLLTHTDLEGLTFAHRGKVRDVYEVDAEHVLLVATDRVSAFDSVLSPGIPYKGAVLNALSAHWFAKLAEGGFSTHFVSARLSAMPAAVQAHAAALRGRITLARRVEIVPVECVVRGYLAGSAVKAYAKDQALHGVPLPGGLVPGDRFPEPVFTPTTKEASGHDEPITYDDVVRLHGAETAALLRERSLAAYRLAAAAAEERGLILVDTKLEFGRDGSGELVIADEVFTAD
ncbi:MAG: phosphoribosylaminoimidazolesuccinocarboxamide synthase, partial [Planctomycetota bacterium]